MSESRRAIIAVEGTFSYDQLDDASRRVAAALLDGRRGPGAGTRGLPGAAKLRVRGGAARHLACRRRGRAVGHIAPAPRAGVRDPRLGRDDRRGRPVLRGRADAGHTGPGRASRDDHRDARGRAGGQRAAPRIDPQGHDHLHQRDDGPAQGRGDHPPEHRRADRVAGRGMGLEALGPPAARAAPPPRAWPHQRAGVGACRARHVRDDAGLRCRPGVGSSVVGRHHRLYGRAHHLQPPDRGLGRRRPRRARGSGRKVRGRCG